MRLARAGIAVALASGCATLDEDEDAIASSASQITGTPAVSLLGDISGPAPSRGQMLQWTPDFSVNVPGFDSLNRAYIRDRTTFMDEIPGTVKRLRFGAWEERSFEGAIREELPCPIPNVACKICYDDAGGEYGSLIVFDKDDRAYTAVHAYTMPSMATCPTSPPTGSAHLFLLHSSNYGSDWTAEEMPCGEQFAIERPHSPEPLEGPPALLVRDTNSAICGSENGALTVVKPRFTAAGELDHDKAELTRSALNISSHSASGTQVLTYRGMVYAAWTDWVPLGSPDPAVHVASFDPATLDVREAQRVRPDGTVEPVAYATPEHDNHVRPALVMDTSGHLHLVAGSHNCQFRYLHATGAGPMDNFTEAASTLEQDLDDCDSNGQTYVGIVRDGYDALHLTYRYNDPDGYKYLVYQRKLAGSEEWMDPKPLVKPPPNHVHYSTYYQQLTIDRRGSLYLLFSWWTYKNCEKPAESCAPPGSWFGYAQLFTYAGLLVSRDGGNSWQLGSTAMFDDATFWQPASGAVADVDGNGLKDVVHAYWDHGFELHVDASQVIDGVWQWVTRGRRDTDGAQILQRPMLAGYVNTDTREDLVFIYNQPDVRIRTKLARADGGFDTVEESDGGFAIDPSYPILMGDVTGDGRADIVMPYWANNCLNIHTKVGIGNGTWLTNNATCVALSRMNTYAVKLGRMNDDPGTTEKDDLVFLWRDTAGVLRSRVLLAGTSAGGLVSWTATTEQTHGDGAGIHQYPHLLGDVNGDGFGDLVFLFRHWDTGSFTVRVKFAQGNGYGWSGSRESQHPDGSQVPHYPPMIGKVNPDNCADILLPHRLGTARDGDYQLRTFLAVCDGSKNAQWTRTTTRLP